MGSAANTAVRFWVDVRIVLPLSPNLRPRS
jgi:hypothetical protein